MSCAFITVAPYIRWSYYQNDAVRLFLDGTAAIGFVKIKDGDTTKAGQIGLRPGIAVKLNDHFSSSVQEQTYSIILIVRPTDVRSNSN